MDDNLISLNGKVAVVTGAAGGIGAATARLMAKRGGRVVLADIALERASALADEIGSNAFAVHLDLEDERSIEGMIEAAASRFGQIDILHNNAAYLNPEAARQDATVETMDVALWDKSFAINVRGSMIAIRAALPHLMARRNGAIVNTVSNLALQGHIVQTAYAASKAALIQLTRSVAASHGRAGVRCNAVAPGMTMTQALIDAFPPPLRKLVEDETLRDRLGDPHDIAEAVAFLASDAARNINGHCLVSDGGLSSHVPGIAGFMNFGRGDD